jgi:hypothetical protein
MRATPFGLAIKEGKAMVDITVTPANVLAGTNAQRASGTAGVAIAAGQCIYKDSVTGKYLLCDNNATDVNARKPAGIALNNAALNQPVDLQTSGDITLGGGLTAGTDYFLSTSASGGICPRADVVSGMNVCLIGIAKSATVLAIDIQAPGVTL